jgi:hypothetical protein
VLAEILYKRKAITLIRESALMNHNAATAGLSAQTRIERIKWQKLLCYNLITQIDIKEKIRRRMPTGDQNRRLRGSSSVL